MRAPPFLELEEALAWEGLAAERGVSEVARSSFGFMRAYEAAGGDPERLKHMTDPRSGQTWWDKRNNFVARHKAQMQGGKEAQYETFGKYDGLPTRRHLALIMWAYSPSPEKLEGLDPDQ